MATTEGQPQGDCCADQETDRRKIFEGSEKRDYGAELPKGSNGLRCGQATSWAASTGEGEVIRVLASLIEGGPASSIVKEHLLSRPEAPSTADQQCVCRIGFSAADRAALQYGVLSRYQ